MIRYGSRIERYRSKVRAIGSRIEFEVLAIFLSLSALLFAFLRIASEMREGETMAFDRFVILALRHPSDLAMPIGPAWLRRVALDITTLSGGTVLTGLTVVIVGYLTATRRLFQAALVASAVGGGALMSGVLKNFYHRPRPDLVAHLVEVASPSFPSGHAMNSAIVYLTLAMLLARSFEQRAARLYVLATAIGLTLAIGFSRVYLGVHWPTDVLAGWTVGASWALLCTMVANLMLSHETPLPRFTLRDGIDKPSDPHVD